MFEPVLSVVASPLWATTNAVARFFLKNRGAKLKCPVISIGNIVAGGVGKTEVTAAVAKHLLQKSIRTCVASRGYGSQWERQGGVAHELATAASLKFPDEAQVLLRKAPGTVVVVGAARAHVLTKHWEEIHPGAVLLDDGYQHFAIQRDLDVLVHDFSVRWPILREFPIAFSKVPLKIAFSEIPNEWKKAAEKIKKPWIRAEYKLLESVSVSGKRKALPERAFIFCGIGNPGRFRKSLERAGTKVIGQAYLPDHARYDVELGKSLMREIEQAARKHGEKPESLTVLTTLKDFVKLESFIGSQGGIAGFEPEWVDVEIRFLENEEFFWTTIDETVASHSH